MLLTSLHVIELSRCHAKLHLLRTEANIVHISLVNSKLALTHFQVRQVFERCFFFVQILPCVVIHTNDV